MKKIMNLFAMMLMALVANANVININSGTADALRKALDGAATGDVIVMAAGTYVESNSNYIAFTGKNVTVMAEKGAEVIVQPKVPVRLKEGARAEFIGIKFDCGHLSDLASYDNIIVPADDTEGKKVILENCEFYGWTQNNSIIHTTSSRRLDSVVINDCYFHNNIKSCVFLENPNLKGLSITNSTFADITTNTTGYDAGVIDVRATTGSVRIDHCTFYNVLAKSADYGAIGKVKTTDAVVSNCVFAMPSATDDLRAINMAGGSANNCLVYNYVKDEGYGIVTEVTKTACIKDQDPLFKDAAHGDLRISEGSPVYGAGTDGSALGDPRWIPKMEYYMVGSMTKDALDLNYKMEKNPKDAAEYMYAMTLFAGDYFQVVKSDGMTINPANCYPSSTDKFEVTASGEYTIYFRPEGDGGEGWYKGYIKVQGADLGGWESAFADAEGKAETNSYITYDAAKKKVSIYVREEKKDKAGVQVTYQAGALDADKCYRLAVKINADHDISGVTMKCQKEESGSTVTVAELKVNLGADEAYFYDEVVKGFATLVLDFSAAHKGDVIEISDLNIEETDCPEPPTYYLAGSMTDWLISDAYKFAKNEAVEDEYVLKVDLKQGTSIKVVGVSGENETWYPGGVGKAYVIDAAHAGENTIHFRPAGNAEWKAFGGYFYMDAKTGVEQVGAGMESEKIIRDGKLYIRQNGTIYNVIGQKIAQ